jgi:hypothetical protein
MQQCPGPPRVSGALLCLLHAVLLPESDDIAEPAPGAARLLLG